MKKKKEEYTDIYVDVNNIVIKDNDIVKVVAINEEDYFTSFKIGKFYKIGCIQDEEGFLGLIHNRGTIMPLAFMKHIDLEVQKKMDIKN
jgi:hypothetical protein